MNNITNEILTGERALFHANNITVTDCIFQDGESPLKESASVNIENSIFKWKYPIWYAQDIKVANSTLLETARSGIWYTNDIEIRDTLIQAPKTFRRCHGVTLVNVVMPNALETLWNCQGIRIENGSANGDYFGMNSTDLQIENLVLTGNYSFDGAKNVEIHNSKLISKDAFWNCENVTVYDSLIIGEYIGWNSKNLKFVNCTIESLQGLCYIDKLTMENCFLLNTNLAFEYSTVDATILSTIDSVINPCGGTIKAQGINEIIMEEDKIDPDKTIITIEDPDLKTGANQERRNDYGKEMALRHYVWAKFY